MDPAQFFAASRLVIVAGKGGVGKTTVAAALARAAAAPGSRTLIVEVEGKSGLARCSASEPFDYDEVVLAAGGGPDGAADVRARTLTPDDALVEYLEDHGMSRISKRLVSVRRARHGGHRGAGHQGHPRARQGQAARTEQRRPT